MLDRLNFKIGGIYRHINNLFLDKLILNIRKKNLISNKNFYTPKGKKSAKDLVDALNNDFSIVLLIDQKDSAGENVLFFDKEVKTQIGFLKIARKFNLPIIPIKNTRLKNGQIECRIYNKTKFHAKAYITHPKLEVVGTKALVGSSNFTRPGLSQNVELNVQIQSPSEVSQLQVWYEEHWEDSEEITEDIIKIISRHTEAWSPFDIYTHSLRELFRNREDSSTVWEENESIISEYHHQCPCHRNPS